MDTPVLVYYLRYRRLLITATTLITVLAIAFWAKSAQAPASIQAPNASFLFTRSIGLPDRRESAGTR